VDLGYQRPCHSITECHVIACTPSLYACFAYIGVQEVDAEVVWRHCEGEGSIGEWTTARIGKPVLYQCPSTDVMAHN
jgi:hypothetical protein